MTWSREQFREHVVDYLYGQLEGNALAEFEACLAESEACRRELAALQDTLRQSRARLAELHEPPPPHLQRALRALATQPARVSKSQGFLAFLLQPTWIASLSVAAVVGLAVLTRRHAPAPAPAPAMEERDEPAPPASSEPSRAPVDADEDRWKRGDKDLATPVEPSFEAPSEAVESQRAAPESPTPARRKAPAAQSRSAEPSATPRRYAQPPAPSAPARVPTESRAPTDDYARPNYPSPDVGLGASRSAPAKAEKASGSAPSAPVQAERDAADRAAPKRAEIKGAPSAVEAEAIAEPAPAASDTLERTLRDAREHMQAARWREAISAYERLLQRFPTDARAVEWQRQLALAKRAQAERSF